MTLDTAPLGAGVRRARWAVGALFATNGLVFANVLPRYPEIKATLDLSNAALGSAIAAFPLGALLAGLLAGRVIERWTSARTSVVCTLAMIVFVFGVGVAPSWLALAAVLFCAGAMDSMIDIANNAHGLRIQRRYGRSIINSLHGVWSVGAVVGGVIGSAAAGLGIPLPWHLGVTAVLFAGIALLCGRGLLPGSDAEERRAATAEHLDRRWLTPALGLRLLGLGAIAATGAAVEDSGSSWGALYLTGTVGAPVALAGLAFIALQAAQTAGRFAGDPLVTRFGPRAVARSGAVLAVVGMGTALAFPGLVPTVIGFGLAGWGIAVLIPMAMHAADELPGLPAGAGLTLVGWITRIGFLLSPPLVGLIADAASLRVGLAVVPVAALAVIGLSQLLPSRDRPVGVRAPASPSGASGG